MPNNYFFIIILFLSYPSYAQDSLSEEGSVKLGWYMRMMPISMGSSPVYSSTGVSSKDGSLLKNRITQTIEAGISTNVVDVGLAYGRLNFRSDTSSFLEAKVTMVTCQINRFSNEFSVGFGHAFNKSYPIMLEASTTMFCQVSKYWGTGLIVGYYDFAGNPGDFTKNFYGIFIRYGLVRSETGTLLRRKTMIHRQHRFRPM